MDARALLELVERRLSEGDKFSHIATSLGMGRNVLSRKLAEEGWGGVYSNVPIDELKAIIQSEIPLSRAGANWGIRSVQAALKLRKLRVPRSSVRDALKELQPEQLDRRQVGRLFRGQYTITEPMFLWHMDCIALRNPLSSMLAYDKLVPWKIRLHGCIDGGSHFVVWAKVANNKRAETIYAGYAEAVGKYGHPLRIRSDFASEHVLVKQDITRARPGVYRAYLTGSSVHNQRIEKFWRQVWTHAAWFYKHLLTAMSESGILIIGNPWHVASLHAVIIPALQADVDFMVSTWSLHRVRKIRENGRDLPSHVPPAARFRPAERIAREILAPGDNDAPEMRRLPIPGFNDERRRAPVEEAALVDITGDMALEIVQMRDGAYALGKSECADLAEAYVLHLSITLECAEAARSATGFASHMASIASGIFAPDRIRAASLVLQYSARTT